MRLHVKAIATLKHVFDTQLPRLLSIPFDPDNPIIGLAALPPGVNPVLRAAKAAANGRRTATTIRKERDMLSSISKESPALLIDLGIGVIGFILSFGWGKVSGRNMDRDATLLLVKVWGGIAIFGMVLVFVM
jgi:hypothetical protein